MAKTDYKKAVQDLASRIGKSEARRELVVAGASPHTADKLLRGVYPSEVGHLLGGAIERAIEATKKRSA
jgi:hypothetical protein